MPHDGCLSETALACTPVTPPCNHVFVLSTPTLSYSDVKTTATETKRDRCLEHHSHPCLCLRHMHTEVHEPDKRESSGDCQHSATHPTTTTGQVLVADKKPSQPTPPHPPQSFSHPCSHPGTCTLKRTNRTSESRESVNITCLMTHAP